MEKIRRARKVKSDVCICIFCREGNEHPSTFSLRCHVFFACSNKRLRRSFFLSTLSYSRGLPAYKDLFWVFFATCRTSHKWWCRPPTSLWRSTSLSLFTQHIRLQHDWFQSNQSYAPLLYKTANKGQMKPPLSKWISIRYLNSSEYTI